MSFDKYYPNRKDWRRQYYGSKRFDYSCRNHGGCPYCEGGRLRYRKLADILTKEQLEELVSCK